MNRLGNILLRYSYLNDYRGIKIGDNNDLSDPDYLVYGILGRSTRGNWTITDRNNRMFVVAYSTIGTNIYDYYYERDILKHSDYPGRLFEFTFHKGKWIPIVIYGTDGDFELGQFPQDITEYEICGWCHQYSWYLDPQQIELPDPGLILIGSVEDKNIGDDLVQLYYDSQLGDLGRVEAWTLRGREQIGVYKILDALEKYPMLVEKLKQRKLISDKCGYMF